MSTNITNLGLSGLNSAQVGLAVTANNIANANTPGYSRQQAIQSSMKEQSTGYGFVGQGSQVVDIRRYYNELLGAQVNNATTSASESQAYYSRMSTIDDMLGDSTTGISPALNTFFSSISAVAANPADSATRQTFLTAANSLQSRINDVGNYLEQAQASVNQEISGTVESINSLARQISDLNAKIEKSVNTSGKTPNGLLDQRDQLVTELSSYIKTTVVTQVNSNNSLTSSYNIYIGNGQPLVIGESPFSLTTVDSSTDPSKLDVAYIGKNGQQFPIGEQGLAGGKLGGIISFRNESLDKIQNQVGQMAIAIAQTYNAQNAAGLDYNGAVGGDIFTAPTPTIIQKASNNGNANLTADITSVSALKPSNYKIDYDGTNYTFKRMTDGVTQSFTTMPQVVDGVTYDITFGSMSAGDSFLVKPTASGASDFRVAITDPAKIAASANPSGGKGDNKNALLLAGMHTQKTMNGGFDTYATAFNKLVSEVGVKTNELMISSSADSKYLSQAVESQQSESGVNLDEEAANMIRYQQAYQASAKMIQTVNELFNSILSLGS